jgi:hypothetical protein
LSQEGGGNTAVRHAATSASREVRVFTYADWRSDCSPREPPRVTIEIAPSHGTVTMRPGDSVVREFRQTDCTGHTIPGTAVFYLPEPGFHGSDRFKLVVALRNRTQVDTVIVDVQ